MSKMQQSARDTEAISKPLLDTSDHVTETNPSNDTAASVPGKSGTASVVTRKNILNLQHTVGNQAVQRLIQRDRIRQEALRAVQTPALGGASTSASTDAIAQQIAPDVMRVRGQVLDNPNPAVEDPNADEVEDGAEGAEAPLPQPALNEAQVAAQIRQQVGEEEAVEDNLDAAAAADPNMANLAQDVDDPNAAARQIQAQEINPQLAVAQAQLLADGVNLNDLAQAEAHPVAQQLQQAANQQGQPGWFRRGLNWTREAGASLLEGVASRGSQALSAIGNFGRSVGRGAMQVGRGIVSGLGRFGRWAGGGIADGARAAGHGIADGARAAGRGIADGATAGADALKKNPTSVTYASTRTGYSAAAQGVNAAQNLSNVGATVSTGSLQAASNFGKVNPWFVTVFGAISSALDLRSVISSLRKSSKLDQMEAEARRNGADAALIEALNYAVEQKKKKAGRRGVSLFGNLASTTAGVLGVLTLFGVLASNPVGWAILGLGLAGGAIGIGIFLYKWYRSKKANKGVDRTRHATAILNGVRGTGSIPKADALKALSALGVTEQQLNKHRNPLELIRGKLGSN